MRAAVFSVFLLLLASATSSAESFRPATVAEIMKQLPRLQDMSEDGNGYIYASGSDVGYKVSKGEICVRSPNKRVDCVRVEYDGETLRMVDGRGNKELLR